MGIRNLTTLIKEKSPESINTIALYTLQNKTVAIDTSIFLYKSLVNVRSNGDYLRNKDDKIISHIVGLMNKTIQYLKVGIIPVYIFDGKPPSEKQTVLNERNKKANESKLLSEKSTSIEEKQKHEKSSIRIKKHHIDDLKRLFDLMGISYIQANGEAEAYASELCRKGYVDYVVSEDMDTLVHGCPNMIRSCLDRSIKRRDVVSTINLEKVLKDFNMNMNEFTDMCILSGCDYCPTIPKIGATRSFNTIQKYKSIEKFIESNTCSNIPQEFIDNYNAARQLFTIFKDSIEESPIHEKNCNQELLKQYLKDECSLNDKRIQQIIQSVI
tara:strand:+ start:240 stop:1220 length:981 start_codon:yes stop_codon:yes gene_type:complete